MYTVVIGEDDRPHRLGGACWGTKVLDDYAVTNLGLIWMHSYLSQSTCISVNSSASKQASKSIWNLGRVPVPLRQESFA